MELLEKIEILLSYYKKGILGGEFMPEDENPNLERSSCQNYLYFTLPMALNYQRNSYTLWESANKTYNDAETRFVFDPKKVVESSFEKVQEALTKYKVALQKNKQTEVWIRLCNTIVNDFDGDVRNIFLKFHNNVNEIRKFMQIEEKKKFPYLSGTKICNYWLYVMSQYADQRYEDPENLTVAPDTHLCKATYHLGLITEEELNSNNVQKLVIERWNQALKGTKYQPIDIHTPLWLWSRNGFKKIEKE